jgi:hypothetical protein
MTRDELEALWQSDLEAYGMILGDLRRELERLAQDDTPDFEHARRLMEGLITNSRRKLRDIGIDGLSDSALFERRFRCRVCDWRMFRNAEHLECYLSLADKYPFDRGWDVDLFLVEIELERAWDGHFETCRGSLVGRFLGRVWQDFEPEAGQAWDRAFRCGYCGWQVFTSEDDIRLEIARLVRRDGCLPSVSELKRIYDFEWQSHVQLDGQCVPTRPIQHQWQREGF